MSESSNYRVLESLAPLATADKQPKPTPLVDGLPWWFFADRFYTEAKERFPETAGTKSSAPVDTYGGYERSLLATGKERIRDRREREELR